MSAKEWLSDEIAILMDFTGDLYRNQDECVRDGNIINFNAGVQLPWTDKSDIDSRVKARMIVLLDRIEPKLYWTSKRSVWHVNLRDYPDLDYAIEAISESSLVIA